MKIQDYIKTGNSIKAIHNLLNEGEIKYSIGLQMHITHPSYKGKISLDAITKVFLKAIEQTITRNSTSLIDRAEAIIVWDDLEDLYLDRSIWLKVLTPFRLFESIFRSSKKNPSKIILNTNQENQREELLTFSTSALSALTSSNLNIRAIKQDLSLETPVYIADDLDLINKSGYESNVYILIGCSISQSELSNRFLTPDAPLPLAQKAL